MTNGSAENASVRPVRSSFMAFFFCFRTDSPFRSVDRRRSSVAVFTEFYRVFFSSPSKITEFSLVAKKCLDCLSG